MARWPRRSLARMCAGLHRFILVTLRRSLTWEALSDGVTEMLAHAHVHFSLLYMKRTLSSSTEIYGPRG